LVVHDQWITNHLFSTARPDPRAMISLDPDHPLLKDDSVISGEILQEETRKEQEDITRKEALYLRRHLLVSNDLYTDGLAFKHGVEGAEKVVRREPVEVPKKQNLQDRIEATFQNVKAAPVHPSKPQMKVKRILPLAPNRELWTYPYSQVKFDEVPLPEEGENADVPSIMYKSTPSPRLTAFAVFKWEHDSGHHKLSKSYVWDNVGEAINGGVGKNYVLLEWPATNEAKNEVLFLKLANKLRLKKLTARVQKQKRAYEKQTFGTDTMVINWRDPTAAELEKEQEAQRLLSEHIPQERPKEVDFATQLEHAKQVCGRAGG